MVKPQRIIEGTGEEIARYVREHPNERFQLTVLSNEKPTPTKVKGVPTSETRAETLKFIKSLRGKMGNLPLEATSTDALYD